VKQHWSYDNDVWEKNRNTARKVLSLIFSNECQWHHRIIHISDSLIQFTHHRRWSEADNQMSKSRQSVECFKYFKQSTSSESCRTDLSTDEFIQCMCNTQVSFKAVQKDSNNSIMQIEEKWLYWFKDVSTYCFAWYHEQSAEVDHDQKIEWHSQDSLHAIKWLNESKMQVIHDLDIRFTNRSSSHSVKLWNQICDLHAKLKRRQSI